MLMAYIIVSSLIIITLGCLLHFIYDWTKKKKICALVGAVNESTWEHIKIALVPAILVNLLYFLFTFRPSKYFLPAFLPALAAALGIIMIAIPGLFYLLRAFTKKEILWLDVLIFCVAVVLGQFAFKSIFTYLSNPYLFIECPSYALSCDYYGPLFVPDLLVGISLAFVLLVVAMILICTFHPPKNFLFIDPRNKKYGFEGGEKHCHHLHHHKKVKKVSKTKKTRKTTKK